MEKYEEKFKQFKAILELLKINISNPILAELIFQYAYKIGKGETFVTMDLLEDKKKIEELRVNKPVRDIEETLVKFKEGSLSLAEANLNLIKHFTNDT